MRYMYRLYVDEVGTDDLSGLHKDKHRYLSLTGIAMEYRHARDFLEPSFNEIKAELFDQDPDAPIIFHRSDILGGKGPFEKIRTDETFRKKFNESMHYVFLKTNYKVITVVIDKGWMLEQKHWKNTHPYHFLMEVLTEKYVQFLERHKAKGDIMPESRKGKDGLLQNASDNVRERGTDYVSSERIKQSIPARALKFRCKPDNIAGLQLCDLLAHPSHMFVRERQKHDVSPGPFAKQVFDILRNQKYDRSSYGRIEGYGYKYLGEKQRAA